MNDLRAPVLLVALPQVLDPHFRRSVVLIVRHDEEGTLGFIINRRTDLRMIEVLADLKILEEADQPEEPEEIAGDEEQVGESADRVYYGGPVLPQLGSVFFSVDEAPEVLDGEGVTEVMPGIAMTQQIIDLDRLYRDPPRYLRLYQGCAGWGQDQLMDEILRNDWLTVPATEELIFAEEPESVWERAVRGAGIDPASLPSWTTPADAADAN
ncbi:MAG: YqgE/AlgH family protein [Acidobacteriota bacterium]